MSSKKLRVLIDYPIYEADQYEGLSFPHVLWAGLENRGELDVFSSLSSIGKSLDAIFVFNGGSHRDLTDMKASSFSAEFLLQELYTKKEDLALRIGKYVGLRRMRYFDRLTFRNREYEKTLERYKRKNPSVKIIHRLDGNYRNICKRYGFDSTVRYINDLADITVHQSDYSAKVWVSGIDTIFGKTQILDSKKSVVIWNGVNTKIFNPAGERRTFSGKINLLHVSASSNPNKGLSSILELANILKENADFQVYLVGNQMSDPLCGDDIRYFQNVHHLGVIKDREELAKIYRGADIFCYPSKNDCSPNVVLEAMASGLPVITIDSGGNKELIIKPDCKGGVLMNRLNPVLSVKTIQENYKYFSEGALSVIEKYHTIERMAADYMKLLVSPT